MESQTHDRTGNIHHQVRVLWIQPSSIQIPGTNIGFFSAPVPIVQPEKQKAASCFVCSRGFQSSRALRFPTAHLNVSHHGGIMKGWNFCGLVYTGCEGHMSVLTTKWQPVNFGYNFPILRPTHHSNNGNNQKGAYGKIMEGILLRLPTGTETTSSSANSCRLGEQKEQLTYRFALFYAFSHGYPFYWGF